MTWKAYVPTHITTYSAAHGFYANAPVTKVAVFQPGQHTESPILKSMTAVRISTDVGERWYGVDKAYIDGSLRMVVERAENHDEVLAKWESVPERK